MLHLKNTVSRNWDRRLYVACLTRKKAVQKRCCSKSVEVKRNWKTDKERSPLCLGGKDVKHILLECSETGDL